MEFRPCIDIHNGKVKQIVGSSLRDAGDQASENLSPGRMHRFMHGCIRAGEFAADITFY